MLWDVFSIPELYFLFNRRVSLLNKKCSAQVHNAAARNYAAVAILRKRRIFYFCSTLSCPELLLRAF
ncbi:hypothetical protein CLOSYM_02689 [[Clostridium] symbiosum ATCC 14940]|uniref:Uncharacterized protein n=1 Tax=[Clostridium] symbiosum ATCC 14940 TaxID=411472 RepID=A0ABC9TWQ0_CLOSY|nr:hypothetical protein CLOSYM_02689 [[Clostridium] symbiosum ATCC 14940]